MNSLSLSSSCVLAAALVLSACKDNPDAAKAAGGHAGKGGSAASVKTDAGTDNTPPGLRRLDGGEHAAGQDEGIVSSFLADAGGGWKSLIQAHWVLAANSEQYRCARVTVTQDVALHAFRALSPLGTHHTVLTVNRMPTEPDGLTVCDVTTNAQGMLSASGVGTNDFTLPDGVAVKVHAGEQLLINMHLFNVSNDPIEGTSGSLVQTLDDTDIVHEAEAILAGPVSIAVPPHARDVVVSGNCTMNHDSTFVAVGAHAHMHATHVKVTAHSSGAGDVVIHDMPYSFDSQLVYPIDALELAKGDKLQIDCTYDNDTDSKITFGDSSLAEMCFAGLFRYPADLTQNFLCTQ